MNKQYRLIWSDVTRSWVVVAEIVKSRGKRASGVCGSQVAAQGGWSGALRLLLTPMALALSGLVQAGVPASTELPTGGQVVGGVAGISQSGSVLNIDQSSQRAAINWQTFNIGSAATVNFNQPSSSSVTLNRVLDSNPSQIYGKLNANGQVFLSNPSGVYFAPGASANVGGMVATTHDLDAEEFMAGSNRFKRDGATGSVVNEGNLQASLGGYIALLAPEVRNRGVIIAQLGTVALAAGETFELQFEGNGLANLRIEPATINTLVENGQAVHAPGGQIILSALAVDHLQGSVINSGELQASGLQMQGGRIVLEASDSIDNSGSLIADASTDGPAGSISLSAPGVRNSGVISAQAPVAAATAEQPASGGNISVRAVRVEQSAEGVMDAGGAEQGGSISFVASGEVQLAGKLDASAVQDSVADQPTQGGSIEIAAAQIVTLSAVLDASGGEGGSVQLQARLVAPETPTPLPAPEPGQLALTGSTTISTRGRRGQAGGITLLGDDLSLNDSTHLDASGSTGGGKVRVGGDWQGSGHLYQATRVSMAQGASIDASATEQGDGGTVVLWSQGQTYFDGTINAKGTGTSDSGGNGGNAEVSGKAGLAYNGLTDLRGGNGGSTGNLLLDPYNLYIVAGSGGSITASGDNSMLGVDTLTTQLGTANINVSTGASGTQSGRIVVNTDITSASTNDLTLTAAGDVVLAGNVILGGKLTVAAVGDFVMGINTGTGAGVSISANGGFSKTGSGTSYLSGNITTQNTAIDLAGPTQIANFNGTSALSLNSNGGNIGITGAVNAWSGTAQSYAAFMSGKFYDNVTGSVVTGSSTDIYLQYGKGNSYFFAPTGVNSVQYLVVGGGGSGGRSQMGDFTGGGGGGGGVADGSYAVTAGQGYSVTVGAGGLSAGAQDGQSGADSSFDTIKAGGGGRGSDYNAFAVVQAGRGGAGYAAGGGGGGAGGQTGSAAGGGTGSQRSGGSGSGLTPNGGGGGGGGAGGSAVNTGAGGAGISSSIKGTSTAYGVGGAVNQSTQTPGTGGGAIGYSTIANGADGTVVVRYSVGAGTSAATSGLNLNAGTGTITLGSTVTNLSNLTLNSGGASSVAGIIAGTGSLTKAGAGTLTLSTANTYSGGTTVSGGVLKAGVNTTGSVTNGPFGTGAVTVASGGAVDLNGKTISNAWVLSGTGTSNSGALFNSTSTNLTVSGAITLAADTSINSTAGGALTLGGTVNGAYGLTVTTDGATDGAYTQSGVIGGSTALSSYTVNSGTANATLSAASTVAGPISITAAKIDINANLSSTAAGAKILAKASGNITVDAAKSLTTNGGDITLWADSDASNAGGILVKDNATLDSRTSTDRSATNTSTASGGGKITLGGGLDDGGAASGSNTLVSGLVANDGRPDGYAVNYTGSLIQYGIMLGTDTSAAGHNSGIKVYSGGDIRLHGKATSPFGSNGPTGLMAYSGLQMNAGTSGNLSLLGVAAVTSGFYSVGMDLNAWRNTSGAISTFETVNGNIHLVGRGSGGSNDNQGLSAAANDDTRRITFAATGSGSITLDGQKTGNGSFGMALSSAEVLAASGNISLIGGDSSLLLHNQAGGSPVYLGSRTGSLLVANSTSNISLTANALSVTAATAVQTSGNVTVQPYGTSFTSTLSWPIANLTLSSNVSGLTLGKSGNAADITIGSATTIAGPINIYGGNIGINAALTATNSTILLTGSGNVTDGASGYLVADKLALLGGNVTLDNTSNNVATLAASGVSGLTYVDSNALIIGSVGSTNGVSATGVVSIGTQADDLTVSQNVATSNTTATALTLNAGISTAAGTATGGKLIISGSPTVSVGSGGTAKLYSGSISDSTGLTALIGSGSGRFRYNSDESASNYTTALGTGLFAIYREQPTANVIVGDQSITYGDSLTFTGSTSGTVNGDTPTYGASGAVYSTSGTLKAGSYTLTATGLAGLGYNVTGSNGTLTVNTKTLTLTGFDAASKTYDGSTVATINNAGSLSGLVSGDLVTVSNSGASFANKHAGTAKTVTLNGVALGSDNGNADAANYTIASTATDTANISALGITLTADAKSKTYGDADPALTYVAGTALLGSDAFTGALSRASGENVGSYAIGQGTLSINDGNDGNNYAITYVGNNLSINQRAITLSANAGSKTYGDLDPTLGVSITGGSLGSANVSDTLADVTGTLSRQSGENVGSYDILLGTGSKVGNYAITYVADNNAFSISAKALSLAGITGISKTYDGSTNLPTGVAGYGSFGGGVLVGDTVTVAGTAVFDSANAGARTIQQGTVTLTGAHAGNYTLNWTDGSGTINKATLTVRADNDAKFVTQTDAIGYASASYSGFVNGETSAVLGGALSISRSNAGSETAGIYSGVLVASGLSADNYAFNYVNGDYTIVPSSQLLIRVADVINSYGTVTDYTIVSAQYWNGSAPVDLTSVSANGSNNFTVTDGAGGTASFTLAALSAVLSGAQKLVVGSYQLGLTGTVTENSINFSDTITVVGSHSVAQKALTASASSGISKTYDGNTSMSGVSLSLGGMEAGDLVSASGSGAFASKNAGSNLSYTVSGLLLDGDDMGNYYIQGGSFSGSNGEITRKTLTLDGVTVADKVYDGNTSATIANIGSLGGLIAGDSVGVSNTDATFADKNVGTNKTVTISGLTLDGADEDNYTLASTATTTADITRLGSVEWIGPDSGGNWFDPANWAGGAVPDLSNVADVIIPDGVTVIFDTSGATGGAETGAVNIDSIGTAGSLTQNDGTLNVGDGGIILDSLTQNGGTLTSSGDIVLGDFTQTGGSTSTTDGGDFTVNVDYSQGGSGSVTVDGDASITDNNGDLSLGDLTVGGDLSASASDGDIIQMPGGSIIVGGDTILDATQPGGGRGDVILDGTGNDFVGSVEVIADDIVLNDDEGDLILADIDASGDFSANVSDGDITQTPDGSVVVGGDTSLDTTQPGGGRGDVILDGAGNDFVGSVEVTADDIVLNDSQGELILGNIDAGGSLDVQGQGDVIQAPEPASIKVDGPANISSSEGNVVIINGDNDFAGGLVISDISTRPAPTPPTEPTDSVVPTIPNVPVLPSSGITGSSGSGTSGAANSGAFLAVGGLNVNAALGSGTAEGSVDSEGVLVALITESSSTASGLIMVSVPRETLASGQGFSFELPQQVSEQVPADAVLSATLLDGSPLPSWLQFDAQRRVFVATDVPSGALPLRVLISFEGRQWEMIISERDTHSA